MDGHQANNYFKLYCSEMNSDNKPTPSTHEIMDNLTVLEGKILGLITRREHLQRKKGTLSRSGSYQSHEVPLQRSLRVSGKSFPLDSSKGTSHPISHSAPPSSPPPLSSTPYMSSLILAPPKSDSLRDPPLPIDNKDLAKFEEKFQKQVSSHPQDVEEIITAHLTVVIRLANHPLAKTTGFNEWVNTWSVPFSRVAQPSPSIVSHAATTISNFMGRTADCCFEHYKFLRKKENFQKTIDSVIHIVWLFVYDDFWNLLTRTHRLEDEFYEKKMNSLGDLKVSRLKLPPQFHLAELPQPYLPAILTLQQLPNAHSVTSQLACLTLTASKICTCVSEYWEKQGGNRKDITVGCDELLPLMAYVMIKAQLTHMHSHSVFMEMFIGDQMAIQQEGYVLTTYQMAMKLIADLE